MSLVHWLICFFSKQRRRSAKPFVVASPLSCRCTIVKSQSCDQANAELHFIDILCWGFPVKLQNRWGTGLQGAVMRFVCLLLSWTIGTGLADNLWQLRNSKMSKLRSGEQRVLSHTSSDLRTNQESGLLHSCCRCLSSVCWCDCFCFYGFVWLLSSSDCLCLMKKNRWWAFLVIIT